VVGSKEAGAAVWAATDPAWVRANFAGVASASTAAEKATDLGPQDITWLAEHYRLPVVVKGVLHPGDARRCVDAGAAAVWVSNHGGRQLARAVATADALPAVAAEVGDAAEVYVDGGIVCGEHALVAAALGARAVFLGRSPLLALATGGTDGARTLLEGLARELEEALRLSGHTALHGLPEDLVNVRAGL